MVITDSPFSHKESASLADFTAECGRICGFMVLYYEKVYASNNCVKPVACVGWIQGLEHVPVPQRAVGRRSFHAFEAQEWFDGHTL